MRRLSLWLLGIVVCAALLYVLVPVVSYETIPNHNTNAAHFDTLIVLGHPAQADGSPDPEMRERVEEAVREYRAGVAPNIIMSGGPAHNHFVEAQVMADLAEREGVPANAVIAEDKAQDTIQNIWYSRAIMQQKGWTSAEVISSAYHLPRTSLILQRYSGPLAFSWQTHASLWPPEYSWQKRIQYRWHEALGTVKLRLHGFGSRKYLPQA
ncbi:YdcF family protein [Terriglobus sp. TAA 43]|uniref:YdcF family protein n=1 Tax=Terriglobus sp. TAA 43 TaxID=278961 RepID=UPI00064691B3|nr:YdcF family protein [Terriglobus sp. TAA 43]